MGSYVSERIKAIRRASLVQAYDGQGYQVNHVEDKVQPVIYLGLDEGAGVDDLDNVGLMHHQSLGVSLPPLPSGQQTPEKPLFPSPICPAVIF